MLKKLKLPENETILYGLALAQTLGFTYASVVYESGSGNPILLILTGARGLLLGAALSFGAAVAAQKAPRIQSKRARTIGYLSLAGLLIVSPVIMAPAIMAALPETVRAILAVWAQWAVAISLAIAPDFVAVAVATQSGALQALGEPQTAQSAPESAGEVSQARRTAKVKPADKPFVCDRCGVRYEKQTSLAAHRAHCKVAGYEVKFTPVKKEGKP